jgi:hypothetical protein
LLEVLSIAFSWECELGESTHQKSLGHYLLLGLRLFIFELFFNLRLRLVFSDVDCSNKS